MDQLAGQRRDVPRQRLAAQVQEAQLAGAQAAGQGAKEAGPCGELGQGDARGSGVTGTLSSLFGVGEAEHLCGTDLMT